MQSKHLWQFIYCTYRRRCRLTIRMFTRSFNGCIKKSDHPKTAPHHREERVVLATDAHLPTYLPTYPTSRRSKHNATFCPHLGPHHPTTHSKSPYGRGIIMRRCTSCGIALLAGCRLHSESSTNVFPL